MAAEPDVARRFDLLRQAETLLVRDDVPVLPVFNYVGMFAYDSSKWEGIHENLTDEHPFWAIRRRGATTSSTPVTGTAAPVTPPVPAP